jgi:hypothetical protein
VPLICKFYGILIYIYWNDHAPPHFHAEYGEFEALINIETLEIIKGELPKTALELVRRWAKNHKKELEEDWILAQQKQSLKKIEPLQ